MPVKKVCCGAKKREMLRVRASLKYAHSEADYPTPGSSATAAGEAGTTELWSCT